MLLHESWQPRKERANKIYYMICGYMNPDDHKYFSKRRLPPLSLSLILLNKYFLKKSPCSYECIAKKYKLIVGV